MEKINRGIILACLIVTSFLAAAQDQPTQEKDPMQFKIGVFYNFHLNYYGRTDSLQSGGFFPLAEIGFNKHLYVNAAPVFVNNVVSHFEYAGTVATAGYRFSSPKKFSGNIFIVKPFYKQSSGLVESALKSQAGFSLTKANSILNITGGADVKFSDKTDFGVNAGLDHLFRWDLPSSFVLVVDPTAYVYAGTQQFTTTYYKQSNLLFLPGTEQAFSSNVSHFNILSYEVSMPVIVGKGKFQFIFIPAYVIPQNLQEVEGRPDLSERGRQMLYATLGVKASF